MKTYRTLLSLAVIAAALGAGTVNAATAGDTGDTTVSEANKAGRVASDTWITTQVKSELLADTGTKSFKVSVKTKFKTVWLKGKLPSQEAIDQVRQLAERVEGVKKVDTSGLSVIPG